MQAPLVVFTDGACIGNPGPGGWAWATSTADYASGAEPHTTNQRMELTAAAEAVRRHPGVLEVVSDSSYVVRCFNDRWWEGWLRRGWKNSKNEPVANRDLWEPFVEEVRRRSGEIQFRWVKGHAGHEMNEFVDGLTNRAARSGLGSEAGVLLPGDSPDGDAAEREGPLQRLFPTE